MKNSTWFAQMYCDECGPDKHLSIRFGLVWFGLHCWSVWKHVCSCPNPNPTSHICLCKCFVIEIRSFYSMCALFWLVFMPNIYIVSIFFLFFSLSLAVSFRMESAGEKCLRLQFDIKIIIILFIMFPKFPHVSFCHRRSSKRTKKEPSIHLPVARTKRW